MHTFIKHLHSHSQGLQDKHIDPQSCSHTQVHMHAHTCIQEEKDTP